VNIGGIANLTDVPPGGGVRGFDTGPGNVLLDLWHAKHLGEAYDREGAWARTGAVDAALLANLLAEPYFKLSPPKSTGRDLFNETWLADRLAGRVLAPPDVQATLVALTAASIADAVNAECADAVEVLVCGGGARNAALMEELARRLRPRTVESTASHGIPVDQVEALAFAWLARETLAGRAGNLPAVTGARGPRVLGAIYPR
jgi:anhydro-N-acetylmuramic acid kinase